MAVVQSTKHVQKRRWPLHADLSLAIARLRQRAGSQMMEYKERLVYRVLVLVSTHIRIFEAECSHSKAFNLEFNQAPATAQLGGKVFTYTGSSTTQSLLWHHPVARNSRFGRTLSSPPTGFESSYCECRRQMSAPRLEAGRPHE